MPAEPALGVRCGHRAPARVPCVELGEEDAQRRRLERVEARVVAHLEVGLLVARSVRAQEPRALADPVAWAASSRIGRSSSRSASTGAAFPNRWTGTIARVRSVSARSTVSRVTQKLAGSTSQNTGLAPIAATASAVA